jgi:hypothetical protein
MERGFLTTRGTPIVNAALIAQVLEASHLLPGWALLIAKPTKLTLP